jgi:hypothetical protein
MSCSNLLSEAVLNLNYKQRQYNNDSMSCSNLLSEAVGAGHAVIITIAFVYNLD